MTESGLTEFAKKGSMITVAGVFDMFAKAHAAMDRYRGEYPPEGYGTTLRVEPGEKHLGLYFVAGYRFASCD